MKVKRIDNHIGLANEAIVVYVMASKVLSDEYGSCRYWVAVLKLKTYVTHAIQHVHSQHKQGHQQTWRSSSIDTGRQAEIISARSAQQLTTPGISPANLQI